MLVSHRLLLLPPPPLLRLLLLRMNVPCKPLLHRISTTIFNHCCMVPWHSLQDQMGAYVQLLVREMEASRRLNEGPLQTVFFGGGALGLSLFGSLQACPRVHA